MSKFRLFLRREFLHFYAWALAIPGTFLCGILTVVIVSYVEGEGGNGFLHTLGEVFANSVLLTVLILLSVIAGYVEAWYVRKKRGEGKEADNGNHPAGVASA